MTLRAPLPRPAFAAPARSVDADAPSAADAAIGTCGLSAISLGGKIGLAGDAARRTGHRLRGFLTAAGA